MDMLELVEAIDPTVIRFRVGSIYATRSICDHSSLIRIKVESRTPHYITTATGWQPGAPRKGDGKRFRVTRSSDGVERVSPWGSYSMSPIITAKDEEV